MDTLNSPSDDFNFNTNYPSESFAPYKLFNIGNSKKIELMDYIKEIEKNLNTKAIINFTSMQPGDVKATEACTKKLEDWINFKPNTSIE